MPICKCASCGTQQTVSIPERVNVRENPEFKAGVRDGSIFVWTCPECGKPNLVTDQAMLYHDPDARLMVYLLPPGSISARMEDSLAKQSALISESLGDYTLRRVDDVGTLMEKVKIFDAGLDDRVIEVVKLTVAELAARQNPGILWDNIFYTYGPDGRQLLSFMKDGAAAFSVELPDELYNSIWIAYSSKWPALRMSEPVIDRKWAVSQIG